jgi:Integrase core domain/Chromo (CHRromatin Organisation MOdifier) domain
MNATIYNNYLNPSHPTAFGSLGTLKRFYKGQFTEAQIRLALSHADSYTLHREVKKPKVRNPIFVYSLREQVQMDLIDVRHLAEANDGVTFILSAIDCFSRKAWLVTMKRKTAENSLAAIKSVVEAANPPIRGVFFDRGSEFKNKLVHAYLKEKKIGLFHPFSEIKAPHVERFNRTIQTLMYRYMKENEKHRYVDALPNLLTTYNNRGHRTLRYMTPEEAEKPENQSKVLDAVNTHYSKIVSKPRKPRFYVGQTVRIAKLRDKMLRGYNEQFNQEYFTIVGINKRLPVPMYQLKSMDTDEVIEGFAYAEELQAVGQDGVFKIDRVLKTKGKGKNKKVLVSWKGFGDRHNSWEPAANLMQPGAALPE